MNALFMIEGGPALVMVREHIAERSRVLCETRALAREIGARELLEDRTNGTLRGVVFEGEIHPDFKKPTGRHRVSYPKKGSTWEKRLKEQVGYRPLARWVSGVFDIPLRLTYSGNGGSGSSCIGSPLVECGFLYTSKSGPYAMWVPDVPAKVAEYEKKGYVVEEPARSFKLDFVGCRRIEEEEWEILVLQKKLEAKTCQPSAE